MGVSTLGPTTIPDDVVQAFARDGHVCLRGLFDPDEVADHATRIVDAGVEQIKSDTIGIIVSRQDHCALAGSYAVQPHKPLSTRTHHYTRKVVVVKQRGLLKNAGT